ncbi:NAD(P)-binding protein [Streptomyces vietnamensis]|uniref:NAD(P)-binding protein n=1 Tax=Streptomyces vietnamensis TaxID=362257 RepID=UPI0037AB21F6
MQTLTAEQPLPVPRARRRTRADSTVTVVGAGMAGLVAAYELEQLGFRIEVVEGSRRRSVPSSSGSPRTRTG